MEPVVDVERGGRLLVPHLEPVHPVQDPVEVDRNRGGSWAGTVGQIAEPGIMPCEAGHATQ